MANSVQLASCSGTSKEAVTVDYENRLRRGSDAVQRNLMKSLLKLHGAGAPPPATPRFCSAANALSECAAAAIGDEEASEIAITVFNGATHSLNTTIRVPYDARDAFVQDDKKRRLPAEVSYGGRLSDDSRKFLDLSQISALRPLRV